MKRRTVTALALMLALAISVLAACGGAATETTTAELEDVTTVGQQDVTTTAVEQEGTSVTAVIGGVLTTLPAASDLPEAVPGAYTDLTPEQAKQLIETTPDLVIIDVSPVYAEGHLPGAVGYYAGDGSLEAALPTLDQSVPYLVYCHTDSASIAGAQALVGAGFPTVYRLQGNYSAWVAAGYPVEP